MDQVNADAAQRSLSCNAIRSLTKVNLGDAADNEYLGAEATLWIFGYGSLMWNPGFTFVEARRCKVRDWARRMWQRNTTYRGTTTLPGRVAIIVPEADAETFGVAYKTKGPSQILAALEHLNAREVRNGYHFDVLRVQLLDVKDEDELYVDALTVTADSRNPNFLGYDGISIGEMAWQIIKARGKAGFNSDYVLQLAETMRQQFPAVMDSHLFELEHQLMLAYARIVATM